MTDSQIARMLLAEIGRLSFPWGVREEIETWLKKFTKKPTKIMDKPKDFDEDELPYSYLGKDMHTHRVGVVDEDTWCYPDGVEEKIKDDKTYLVWARIHDAADPQDFSTTTRVIYVEEL